MAQLGSIYEQGDEAVPRGQDLHHHVQVPAQAVGHAPGCRVRVPMELPGGGLRHQRVPAPGEDGEEICLQLPAGPRGGGAAR
jgi:hypothetical protein